MNFFKNIKKINNKIHCKNNDHDFEAEYESHLEIVHQIIKKTYGKHFRFYVNKGFRKYDVQTGTWIRLTLEEAQILVWEAIKNVKSLESKVTNVIHNPNFWAKFLNWFTYTDRTILSKEKRSLLGFKNGTLDLESMTIKEKSIDNHCFQSIETDFNHTILNETSLIFFMKISSYDVFTLNILRALIKITLIDPQNIDLIFYLFGTPDSGKKTLFKYLTFLTFGNAVDL